MRNLELLRQSEAVSMLIQRTGVATWDDIQLQGHWGRYLCVLAAGLLENSLKAIYSDFVRGSASPQVANFATSMLENIQNPKAQRFVETARAFNPEWARDLEAFLDSESGVRKDAIDSIMNNRHQIAHGRNTSISVARVREYLRRAIEVIDYVETQCLGSLPT